MESSTGNYYCIKSVGGIFQNSQKGDFSAQATNPYWVFLGLTVCAVLT